MATSIHEDWMTIDDLVEATGLSHSAVYSAAANETLPIPVIRFGRRYLFSRHAWEAVKYQMKGSTNPPMENTNEPVGVAGA